MNNFYLGYFFDPIHCFRDIEIFLENGCQKYARLCYSSHDKIGFKLYVFGAKESNYIGLNLVFFQENALLSMNVDMKWK